MHLFVYRSMKQGQRGMVNGRSNVLVIVGLVSQVALAYNEILNTERQCGDGLCCPQTYLHSDLFVPALFQVNINLRNVFKGMRPANNIADMSLYCYRRYIVYHRRTTYMTQSRLYLTCYIRGGGKLQVIM